ncbi:TPA: GNAT family N-acetyltransferase [Streptococcus equi subsp. zooepidemicus]|nr:GNAT family N-acetyltransferase [Streptococcus equi subsp. zooepidemicus]
MKLRRPKKQDEASILEMMAEFEDYQSPHDGGFWNAEHFDYEEWLESNALMEAGLAIPENWVPAIQLVAFADQQAIGFVNVRLRLNEQLLVKGGHIGYSVRPSQRGKGYAKLMLKEALQLARQKGIREVLVTCHCSNSASLSVILANGGQLKDCNKGIERYWIKA